MRRWIIAVALLAGLGLAGAAAAAEDQITILVSIDGFRASYLDRNVTPNLSALGADGVRGSIQPSFPSVTFPNHFTLITGRYPDRHGIVDNHFEDPTLGRIWDPGDRPAAFDADWFKTTVPLWASAEAQGVRTAAMFWPIMGVDRAGKGPAQWRQFDPNLPMSEEPEQVLSWLDLPRDQRPGLVLLYFYYVDSNGHHFSPESPELRSSLGQADAAVGALVDGLKTRGLYDRTNLVVVADHGMTRVRREQVVVLDDIVAASDIRIVHAGPVTALEPRPGHERQVERALLGRRGHMTCWRREAMPSRFHYGRNPRIAPILCLADLGWEIATREAAAKMSPVGGDHGFDPAEPDMAAVFIAHGPAFRSGVSWPKVPNVDVYPLLAHILDVRPEPNDGRLSDVEGMLRRR